MPFERANTCSEICIILSVSDILLSMPELQTPTHKIEKMTLVLLLLLLLYVEFIYNIFPLNVLEVLP